MQMVNTDQHKELGDCNTTVTLTTKEFRKVPYLRFIVQSSRATMEVNSSGSAELKRHPFHLLRSVNFPSNALIASHKLHHCGGHQRFIRLYSIFWKHLDPGCVKKDNLSPYCLELTSVQFGIF